VVGVGGVRAASRCNPVAASTAALFPHARHSSDSARNAVSSGLLLQQQMTKSVYQSALGPRGGLWPVYVSSIRRSVPQQWDINMMMMQSDFKKNISSSPVLRKAIKAGGPSLTVSIYHPHWGRVVGYGPFTLCVFHN
jgi:hypothetical protein